MLKKDRTIAGFWSNVNLNLFPAKPGTMLLLFLFVLLMGAGHRAAARRAPSVSPLVSVLKNLEDRFGVTFSFSPEALAGINSPGVYRLPANLDSALAFLQQNTAFRLEKTDERNVIVVPKKPGKNVWVTGVVFDQSTMEKLPGATVFLKTDRASCITDASGKFELPGNLNEPDTVVIQYIGYKTMFFPVEYFNRNFGKEMYMEEDHRKIDGILVSAYMTSGIDYSYHDQSIVINPDRAGLLPGETETDILTSLDALPGISSPDGKAGNLIIRGSFADQTQITYDDIPIYHKGHYFGTLSPYNAHITDQIKIQRNGAHGAEEGGRVGGSIEITSKNFIPDSASYGIGMATSYISGFAHIPVIKDKFSVLLGTRTAHPFTWKSPRVRAISRFIFQESEIENAMNQPNLNLTGLNLNFFDVNAKAIYKLNPKNILSLSVLQIGNSMNVQIDNLNPVTYNFDTVALNNTGINLLLETEVGKNLHLHSSITGSDYYQKFQGYNWFDTTLTGKEEYINRLKDFSSKLEGTYTFKNKNRLLFGYNFRFHDVRSEINRFDPLIQENIDLSDVQTEQSTFVNYSIAGLKRINGSVGLRTNYFTGTRKVYLEPRFSLNVFASEYLTFKTNIGVYNQIVQQVAGLNLSSIGGIESMNWNLSNGTSIPVVNSRQFMTGVMYANAKKGWVFDLEGYFKDTRNITVFNFISNDPDNRFFYGDVESYGVDVLLRKSVGKFEGWTSYSFSKSYALFPGLKTEAFENIWNQTHMVSIVTNYTLKKLKLSAGWKFKSGLAALPKIRTPFVNGAIQPSGIIVNSGAPLPPPVFINPEDEYREYFPNHHQLDISVAYGIKPKRGRWSSNIGLSLQNVYNRRILLDQFPRPADPPGQLLLVNYYGLGFSPALMVNVNW